MSDQKPQPAALPRMINWLWVTIALAVLAQLGMHADAGSLIAVTIYKAHLMSLGGWGGYWLDRALFPYARPHCYVERADAAAARDAAAVEAGKGDPDVLLGDFTDPQDARAAQLRRAVIVAACLVCVGLGA